MDSFSGHKPGATRTDRSEQGTGARSPMPLTLTKKELAQILDCMHRCGAIDYRRMRRLFFTDDILQRIGLTPEEYHKTRVYNRSMTLKIIEVLAIEDECREYAQNYHRSH